MRDQVCRFRTVTVKTVGLAVDKDFAGHLTDTSRCLRSGTRRIAPDSIAWAV